MIQTNIRTTNDATLRCRENYQFFKAVYCNCRHYLCDFSALKVADEDCYIVDIEIPGKGFINIEMQPNGSSWKMINDTDIVDRDLEMMLSNAIDKHLHPYQA
jgi:hypothetical protein